MVSMATITTNMDTTITMITSTTIIIITIITMNMDTTIIIITTTIITTSMITNIAHLNTLRKRQNKQGHNHNHHHDHDHHNEHDHNHRSYKHIVKMIKSAQFSAKVENDALRIFKKIGEAEAKIHGVALENVHFHEVGAVDSIIDIVGTAILLEQLRIDKVISSFIPVGSGSIHIDHGVYPVPAPATLEILKGIPISASELKGELTTPTGAAIVAELADEFSTVPTMKVESVGYGAGTRNYPKHPNVLRVMIGEK